MYILKKSLKGLKLSFLYTVILDIFFYLSLAAILYVAFLFIQYSFASMQDVFPSLGKASEMIASGTVPAMDDALLKELEATSSSLKTLYFTLLAAPLVVYLIFLALFSFFKGWIWAIVLEKKFKKNFFKKFFFLSVLWNIPWTVLMIVFYLMAKQQAFPWFFLILLLFYGYFSLVLFSSFDPEKGVFHNLGKIKLGIAKIGGFILPYTVVILALIAATFLSRFLQVINLGFIAPLLPIAVIGWARIYFVLVST